jgi:hypothetical protein
VRSHGVFLAALAALALPLSAQAQLVWRSDIPGTFVDITTNGGIPLNLGDEDETIINVSVSNPVFPAGPVVVANNGGAAWAPPSTDLAPNNQQIPSPLAFGGGLSLLAFWDDIGNTVGDVWYLEDGDNLIIQWKGNRFGDSNDTTDFQLQVRNYGQYLGPGIEIFAQLLYADIQQPRAGGGASATIGFQADAFSPFVSNQFSFDTANSVYNGTVLTLMLPEPTSAGLMMVVLLTGLRRR